MRTAIATLAVLLQVVPAVADTTSNDLHSFMKTGTQAVITMDPSVQSDGDNLFCATLSASRLVRMAVDAKLLGPPGKSERIWALLERWSADRDKVACRRYRAGQDVIVEEHLPNNRYACVRSANAKDIQLDEEFCYWVSDYWVQPAARP